MYPSAPGMVTDSTARTPRLEWPVLSLVFAASASWLSWLAWGDLAPGDSGEIGGASFVLGVAHPTGFPLDLLLLRAMALLPLGSIAFRQNVCVALMSAGAVTATAALGRELCARARMRGFALDVGACFAAVSLLTFETFLGTAQRVEVYSTALCLVACAALAALRGGRSAGLAWALFGLSLGAHVTAGLLMLPVLGALVLARGAESARAFAPRAVMVLLGALVLTYLPLAALRDPPLNWGDPRTLPSFLSHLTAARIRSSYAGEMFASGPLPAITLARQLASQPILLLPAAWGLWVLLSRARRVALALVAVFAFDLAYAIWVNPMGIAQRQLGHASGAVIAIAAGVGFAELCAASAAAAYLRGLVPASVAVLAAVLCWQTVWPTHADGYVLGERAGSGSPMMELPPRSVYLCSSDSSCAAGLFASHVELARPDVWVAPAQHLWDRSVLRKLAPVLSAIRFFPPAAEPVEPRARVLLADRVLAALVTHASEVSVFFETDAPIARAVPGARIAPALPAPLLRVAPAQPAPGIALQALAQVDAQVRARFGAAGPRHRLAQDAWFDAYDAVGKGALVAGDIEHALAALRRAVALSPLRAVGHSNLGVALEASGDLHGALAATRRAIEIDPLRPTAWANLARLSLRVGRPDTTREILEAARALGIRDARLALVARELAQRAAVPGASPVPSRNAGNTSK